MINTPLKSIRAACRGCGEGSARAIQLCRIPSCPLYRLRLGKRPKGIRPLKQIRAYCLDCHAGSVTGVKGCHLTDCHLWPYRAGHRPKIDSVPNLRGYIEGLAVQDVSGVSWQG